MTVVRAAAVALAVCVAVVSGGLAAVAASGDGGWERAASMSQRRSYVAAAELEGAVYAAGGMVGETGRPLATFARYEPDADRWEVLPRLPVATRAAAGAALDGLVHVVGGTTGEGNTRATWAYDPATRRWRARAPLPEPRFNHSAVSLGGKLYVLGGFADGRERDDVLAYDPRADRWTRVTRLPRPLHAFGAVAVGDEIWVLGGRAGEEALHDVWILDPLEWRWRRGPSMPKPMELLGVAADGDEIHAVWESTYQILDLTAGRWRDGPRPLVTRHALEAFAIDGVLYTVGGCTTALQDSPVVERVAIR